MSQNSNSWGEICEIIQNRVLSTIPKPKFKQAQQLRKQILRSLTRAASDGILKTPPQEIYNLLKLREAEEQGKNVFEITGGQRNFKRRKDIPHFERMDGCWFDFAIFINQNQRDPEIIGFNFEIRFPENYSVQFLRFDFNLPNHRNEERGMRFHIHPGHDDFMIPSSPLSPLEILALFLNAFPINDRPRTISK